MLMRLAHGLTSRWRRFVLSCRGVRFSGSAWLRAVEVPRHPGLVRIGQGVALDRGVTLVISRDASSDRPDAPVIEIGDHVYINRHTILDASERLTLGAGTMIGPFCYLSDHDHAREAQGQIAAGKLPGAPVRIGAHCWLGAHVSVLKGVTIGDGATVGAGAVVTKDLPPGCTAVGNPARIIRPGGSGPPAEA